MPALACALFVEGAPKEAAKRAHSLPAGGRRKSRLQDSCGEQGRMEWTAVAPSPARRDPQAPLPSPLGRAPSRRRPQRDGFSMPAVLRPWLAHNGTGYAYPL